MRSLSFLSPGMEIANLKTNQGPPPPLLFPFIKFITEIKSKFMQSPPIQISSVYVYGLQIFINPSVSSHMEP